MGRRILIIQRNQLRRLGFIIPPTIRPLAGYSIIFLPGRPVALRTKRHNRPWPRLLFRPPILRPPRVLDLDSITNLLSTKRWRILRVAGYGNGISDTKNGKFPLHPSSRVQDYGFTCFISTNNVLVCLGSTLIPSLRSPSGRYLPPLLTKVQQKNRGPRPLATRFLIPLRCPVTISNLRKRAYPGTQKGECKWDRL